MFKYEVSYWSDYSREEITEIGVVTGASYAEAAANLFDIFDTDLCDMYLMKLTVEDEKTLDWDELKLSFQDND